MYRRNLTWFGFNISQKQAVQIFILSLIGIIFTLFVLSSFIMSYIMSFMYYDPLYYPDNYILQTLISMLPYLILVLSIFLLSCYSAVRCRKIAKYHSYNMLNQPQAVNAPQSMNAPQYCPNCGHLRVMGHKFCQNCGENY
jgi:hypothetical protein